MRIRFSKWNNPNPMLVGLCVGLGIGAALGIMLAPRSGKDTQDWLVEKGKQGAQGVSDKVTELGAAAKQWTKTGVEAAEEAVATGTDRA
jgi:gas vesicle protein